MAISRLHLHALQDRDHRRLRDRMDLEEIMEEALAADEEVVDLKGAEELRVVYHLVNGGEEMYHLLMQMVRSLAEEDEDEDEEEDAVGEARKSEISVLSRSIPIRPCHTFAFTDYGTGRTPSPFFISDGVKHKKDLVISNEP
jgi:hypothetical protein